MKRFSIFIVVFVAVSGLAAIIPSYRLVNWRPGIEVGYEGGIPDTNSLTLYTNLVTAGGDNTGVNDCAALINTLYTTAPSNSYIYVPPNGNYKLTTTLSPRRGVHLIGHAAGMSNTVLFTTISSGAIVNFGEQTFNAATDITNGYTKGSTNLVVKSTSGLVVGDSAMIDIINNPAYYILGTFGNVRIFRQQVRVRAISGQTVTIWPPLVLDFPTNLNPRIQGVSFPIDHVTFQNFSMSASNPVTTTLASGFNMVTIAGAQNVGFSRIRFQWNPGYCVVMDRSVFVEVRSCQFLKPQGSGGSGLGGVIVQSYNTGILVEDNFFTDQGPSLEMNSSSGNAVLYNFSTNAILQPPYMGQDFNINHGAHSAMNLYEGNRGGLLQSDGYFGSQSHAVVFRNRITGYDPGNPQYLRAIDFNRVSTSNSVVGNVLGSTNLAYTDYIQTNLFWSPTVKTNIFVTGFPNTGNSSFLTAERTPQMDWRFPATLWFDRARPTFIFTLTNTDSGTTIPGLMTNWDASETAIIQRASNTNEYYIADSEARLVSTGDGTSTSVSLLNTAHWTNGDTIWLIGNTSYQGYYFADWTTHIIEGNYDVPFGSARWTNASPQELELSYAYTGTPSWWPSGLNWPPYTNTIASATNYLPAEARYYGLASFVSGTTGTGQRPGNRGQGKKR